MRSIPTCSGFAGRRFFSPLRSILAKVFLFPKVWGEAPCASAGCRGGASSCIREPLQTLGHFEVVKGWEWQVCVGGAFGDGVNVEVAKIFGLGHGEVAQT